MQVEDCPRPRGETCRPGVVSDPYGRPHRPKSPLLEVSSVSAAHPQHRSDAADQILLHRRDRRGPRRPGSPRCTPQTPDGRRGAMVRRTQQRQLAIRDRRPRCHAALLTGRCDGTRCAVALLRRASRGPVSLRPREWARGAYGSPRPERRDSRAAGAPALGSPARHSRPPASAACLTPAAVTASSPSQLLLRRDRAHDRVVTPGLVG